MALKKFKEGTSARRFMTGLSFEGLAKKRSEKVRRTILSKKSGRSGGTVSVRGKGGRSKRYYRQIDFKRTKKDIPARVLAIEYDPNRTVNIALLIYKDGEKSYILAPEGLKVEDEVLVSSDAEVKTGNALPLTKIPIGLPIHNIELTPGRGGQIVRSAGSSAQILSKENGFAQIKLPSSEVRMISLKCYATIGQLGNLDWKNVTLGKAGRSRHMGRKPIVRGVAQNPRSHPHGGGEGRSGIGMSKPKTFAGRSAVGKTRKKGKYSDKYIIKRRSK